MYKLINSTGTWYDTANVTGMYELMKVPQSTALRSAELELQGTARRCVAASYSAAVGCWAVRS